MLIQDQRMQIENLQQLNEDIRKENEAHTVIKLELDEKISELEQIKLDGQRTIMKLKSQLEDAV